MRDQALGAAHPSSLSSSDPVSSQTAAAFARFLGGMPARGSDSVTAEIIGSVARGKGSRSRGGRVFSIPCHDYTVVTVHRYRKRNAAGPRAGLCVCECVTPGYLSVQYCTRTVPPCRRESASERVRKGVSKSGASGATKGHGRGKN